MLEASNNQYKIVRALSPSLLMILYNFLLSCKVVQVLPTQNPVFEISQQPHHQLTPNIRSSIFSTPSHPYLIFRPGALLLHFLLQELWLFWFSYTPVIPLSGVKPHQKSGIPTTSKHYPLLPIPKTNPTVLRIFL